jgi:prevent-host-death family protein
MTTTSIHQAKTHFSQLVQLAQDGEEIIIVRYNTPVAKLVPITNEEVVRKPGRWKKKVTLANDFDAADAEVAKLMNDSELFPKE